MYIMQQRDYQSIIRRVALAVMGFCIFWMCYSFLSLAL